MRMKNARCQAIFPLYVGAQWAYIGLADSLLGGMDLVIEALKTTCNDLSRMDVVAIV